MTAPMFASRMAWRRACKSHVMRQVNLEKDRQGREELPSQEFTRIRQEATADFIRRYGPIESVPAIDPNSPENGIAAEEGRRRRQTTPPTNRATAPVHTGPRQVARTPDGRTVPIKARTLRVSQVEDVVLERVENHLADLRACLVGTPERVEQILAEQRPQLTAWTLDDVLKRYTILAD